MDDISGKINELFSSPENMEKIRTLIGMLGGSGGGDEHQQERPPERQSERPPEKPPADGGMPFDMPFDASTLLKMQKAFSLIKQDDPRVNFLLALKPNLSEERRKKVDEAIHLLRLINLIPLLQEGILQ